MVRPLVSHQCSLGSFPGSGIMRVEFVVGSLLCAESFFSGYSGFPLSSKTNISKFQLDPVMAQHFEQVPVNSWCSVGKQITFTFTWIQFTTGRVLFLYPQQSAIDDSEESFPSITVTVRWHINLHICSS